MRDRDGCDVFPASFAQQRLWFLDQLTPGSTTYNLSAAFRLAGPLHVAALEQSCNEIVRRHEILRTTFTAREGQPVQVVGPELRVTLPVVDLQALPEREREARAERLLAEEARRPFDLARGPLLRCHLWRLAPQDYLFLLAMHHIVSDGWSMGVLYRELSLLYHTFLQGKAPALPELPIQYADYAVWQREQLTANVIGAELEYWKKQLAEASFHLTFREDSDRPRAASQRASRRSFSLSKGLSEALKALGRQEGTTLFMTLLAAVYLWLRRYTGQEDLVVDSPVAGRNRTEIEALIGFFVNTLLLRARLSGELTFRSLLAQVRTVCLEALSNQNVPFEKVVAILPRRSAAQSPLVRAAFAFQPAPADLKLHGLTASRLNVNPGGTKIELTLFMWEGADGLEGAFEYDDGLFAAGGAAGMTLDFEKLLEAIVAGPDRRLSELAPIIVPAPKPGAERALDVYERSNLTKNQLLVWLGQMLQPEVPLYNVAVTFAIAGKIDRGRFQAAFQTLVNSSDALRTVAEVTDGVPQQKVLDSLPYDIEALDFSARTDPEAAYEHWARNRCRVQFDLRRRLFDTALVKIAEDRFAWYFNQHHLITDGVSVSLIYRYLADFYGRSLDNRLPDMVALPRFQEYVGYERAQRHAPRYAEAEAYWRKKLAEKPAPLHFYGDARPRRTAKVERLSLDLGIDRTRKLKTLAQSEMSFGASEHASIFSVFAAALFVYLYRLEGNPSQSVGVPFHSRSKAFSDTIGLLMEVLPLRIALDENDSFLTVIEKIRADMSEIRSFRGYTLANSPAHRHYDVLLNYRTAPFPSFHGMPMRRQWIHTGFENDALAVQVRDYESAGSLVLDFDFHCDVFTDEQRRDAARHFLNVLETLLRDPAESLQGVSLLGAEERGRILADFNRSDWMPSDGAVLTRLFESQAEKNPDHAALVVGSETLTYAGLNARANRLARHLRSLGAGAEVVVALYADPAPSMLVGILGILKAGAAYLPLDPQYPSERLSIMLGDADARIVVTERRLVDASPALDDVLRGRTAVYLDSDAEIIAKQNDKNFDAGIMPGHLAYVIYTSGSTGTPKGVMIEHGAICNRLQWGAEFYGLNESDRVLQKSTFAFDASVWEIFEPLLAGAQIVMARAVERRNLASLAELMAKRKVTVAEFAPSTLRALLEEGGIARCKALKRVFSGGEALSVELEKRFFETLDAELYNTYGPTEASVDVAHWKCGAEDDRRSVPIGRPIAGMKIHLLDSRLQPVPVGARGELYIGGVGLARGYLNQPELTAEKFIPNPFSDEPGARLYKSGDVARYLPDGNIEFLGRTDDQVKIRGFRVEPGEIEAALYQHPAVRDCVVIAREDEPRELRLVAYVVPKPESPPTVGELRSFLKSKLPDYMAPGSLMLLAALPRTPHGKVDRRALPAPDGERNDNPDYAAPTGPVEVALARIWEELLAVRPIGAGDSFFDLGGHSLLAVQMMHRVEQTCGEKLPLSTLLEGPTITHLAQALVKQRVEGDRSLLIPVQPGGAQAPFFFLHGDLRGGGFYCLKLAQHLGEERPFYALTPHGLNGSSVPPTIEAMAASYIQMARAVQPEGPYFLGGMCNGGVVAFEMARQLEEQGSRVNLVVLVAASARTALARRLLHGLLTRAGDWLGPEQRLALFLRLRSWGHGVRELYRACLRRSKMGARLTRGRPTPATEASREAPADFDPMMADPEHYEQEFSANYSRALVGYVPKPYSGRVALLWPEKDRFSVRREPTVGWGRVASQLKVHLIPGGHITCITQHLESLADRMKACLEEAQGRG